MYVPLRMNEQLNIRNMGLVKIKSIVTFSGKVDRLGGRTLAAQAG